MKIDQSFPHDMFRFLPKDVRDTDETGILERYLAGPQRAWETLWADILALDTLHDIDTIDNAWLTLLKWTVGWTSELESITRGLDSDTLRKLIRVSAKLWKLKGTELGLRDALRVITGRDVVVRNWFSVRWVVGVTGFWQLGQESDAFVVGNDNGDRNEYLTVLFVHNEIGIDRALIRKVVNLSRPLQETIRIVYGALVDDFRLGRQKWVTESGSDVVWDNVNYRLSIPSGTEISANVPALLTAEEMVWRMRVTFAGASGGACQLEFRRGAAGAFDRYRATWQQDGTVQLEVVQAGIPSVLASYSYPGAIPQDQPVVVGVDVARESAGSLRIRVQFSATIAIEYVAPIDEFVPAGEWWVLNSSVNDLDLDDVIALALPVTVDEVSGSGETAGDPDPIVAAPTVITVGVPTRTGLWHASGFRYLTPAVSLYYGTGESGWYTWGTPGTLGGVTTAGLGTSDLMDLSAYAPGEYTYSVQFWQYLQARLDPGKDLTLVEILVNGSVVETITKAQVFGTGTGVSVTTGIQTFVLSTDLGGESDVKIRFNFDSVDTPSAAEGWFVDGVRLLIEEAA